MADLHAGAPHVGLAAVARVVRRLNEQRPDLALLLGDYVDPRVLLGERLRPEDVAKRLGELEAPLGAVAVLGNHDWVDDGPRVLAALADNGLTVLENDAVTRERGGTRLWLVGIADLATRAARLTETLAAVPAEDPVILLSHNPDVIARVPDRVALTLSGHTHGSQVNVPGIRERVTPSRFGARFAGGHVEHQGRHLYVSRGIGTSRYPVRLGAPPELVVITLRAARAGGS